ncbi:MAG: BrnT family toxin [Coleofasciculaceae cyanobacterium SM2_1_6]|nr:BrnT family toxin [Coleofasciculaceae cyanobacterium SM2_1_6]
MQFEWNPDKANLNLKKHDVSFSEASTVFNDSLSMTFPDPDHSYGEERYVIIGLSSANRILVVFHTDRADRIRIISAREATRNEQRFYEDED